jgi:hypothetical protein
MQATTTLLMHECGCEDDKDSIDNPISFCATHQGEAIILIHRQGMREDQLYRCGECGFLSQLWERLERHVYREHLGADRP